MVCEELHLSPVRLRAESAQSLGIKNLQTPQGGGGKDGIGIASVEQIQTSTESEGVNILKVILTNGEFALFEVRNGAKGERGNDGVDGVDGTDGHTPVITSQTISGGVQILSDGVVIGTIPVGGNGVATPIEDNLTSDRSDAALSAKQGKILKTEIDTLGQKVNGKEESHQFVGQTNRTKYDMNDGSSSEDTSYNFVTAVYDVPSWVTKISATFPASNASFGILLYSGTTFVKSVAANTQLNIDVTTLSVTQMVIQVYKGWSASYIFSTNGEIAKIESQVENISQQIKIDREELDKISLEISSRNLDLVFSDLENRTDKSHYNMNDGTKTSDSTGSYRTGETSIPSWATKLTANFGAKNAGFGVLLFNNDRFVAGFPAKTEEIIVDLQAIAANKMVLQQYKTWQTQLSFTSDGKLTDLENNIQRLDEEIASISPDVTYTKIVVERNADDFNSVRDVINSITDASASKRYVVYVPKGRWFECDLDGKDYVEIVGEGIGDTILYCDGMSSKVAPSGYAYSAQVGKPLSEIDANYKHCIFARHNIVLKNLTVEVNNAKYCAHLDDRGYNKILIDNCHLHTLESVNYPIGIGTSENQSIEITNCIFERNQINNFQYCGLYMHNMANRPGGSSVYVSNCQFLNCGFALVDEQGSKQIDNYSIVNSYSDFGSLELTSVADAPYCISINVLGSNVNTMLQRIVNNAYARPNAVKNMKSSIFTTMPKGEHVVGDAIFAYTDGKTIYEDANAPFIGIVNYIIDGIAYIIKGGLRIHKSIISGTLSLNAALYIKDGKLSTIASGNKVGYIIRTMYTDYWDIALF